MSGSDEGLRAAVVPVTPFRQNCTVLWCAHSRRGAVVDPGGDLERVLEAVAANDVTPERILLTHGHLDHAGGAGALAQRLGLPVEGPHRADAFWLEALPGQARRFGFPEAVPVVPDRWLAGGDEVEVGELRLEVRHCPGHTPGHVIFFHAPSRLALVGDVLFRGSVGRSDLPRGDHAQLIGSIRSQLWPLGDDVAFVPGHGPASTFGHERRTNPYCSDFVEI